MREIKFRLYFNKKNEGVINIDSRNCGCGWIQSDDLEFMQYTGLKDKNGVEIYEGDIVHVLPDSKPASIIFMKGGFCVGGPYVDDPAPMCYYPNMFVVGNVYENPELLR